jgi:hypothetical protein
MRAQHSRQPRCAPRALRQWAKGRHTEDHLLSKERANTRLTARVRTCGDRDTRFWLVAATPDATVEILDRLDHLARTRRLPNSLRSTCSTSSRSIRAAAMRSLDVLTLDARDYCDRGSHEPAAGRCAWSLAGSSWRHDRSHLTHQALRRDSRGRRPQLHRPPGDRHRRSPVRVRRSSIGTHAEGSATLICSSARLVRTTQSRLIGLSSEPVPELPAHRHSGSEQ